MLGNNDSFVPEDMEPGYKFHGFYRGFVVDDEDPRDIGRVKVRIPGLHRENTRDEDIPWAMPALGIYRSGGTNLKPELSTDLSEKQLKTAFNKTGTGGFFTVPARGNHVWVFFDQGNHMNPHYFAGSPCDDDWLVQKQYLKDKIENKLDQIRKFKEEFTPEDGTVGVDGINWGDGGHVNTRQNIHSEGDVFGGIRQNNSKNGTSEIRDGNYKPDILNIDSKDKQGLNSLNMDNETSRSWGNDITMDIKPLFDKAEAKPNKENGPLAYDPEWKMDKGGDTGHNINRYVTSFTTIGGTTIIIDNREGQENYYLIHKNYIENLDQHGSRKVFIGQNDPQKKLVRDSSVVDERNKGPDKDVKSSDELAVAGDRKVHILGNFVTSVKGNVFTQVDKNMQIDINESYGVRVKKGDFDIIIDGEEKSERDGGDKESSKEGGKKRGKTSSQFGDLNIAIKKGHMELYVNKNANINVEGMVNLRVGGDMRTHVKKSHHLYVEGDYCEFIKGNKYSTVQKNVEFRYNADTTGHTKTVIFGDEYKDVHKNKHLKVGVGGSGDLRVSVANNNHNIIGGFRRTRIASDDDMIVGSQGAYSYGKDYDLIIRGSKRESVTSTVDWKIGDGMEQSIGGAYDLRIADSLRCSSTGEGVVLFQCNNFRINSGTLDVDGAASFGSAATFARYVTAQDFEIIGALSLFRHSHAVPGAQGGSSVLLAQSPGTGARGVTAIPLNTSGDVGTPEDAVAPSSPLSPFSGLNKGGGDLLVSTNRNLTAISKDEGNTISVNLTKVPSRNHDKRKEKVVAKVTESIPSKSN